jgi:hypothetical protein
MAARARGRAAARRTARARAVLVGAIAVASGMVAGAGCVESQLALRVRDQDPITVSSPAEPIARARDPNAPAQSDGAAPFADRGVQLQSGYELRYRRDGDWIASEQPITTAVSGGVTRAEYTLHPGRRDLPVVLTTPNSNVCDLRVRSRPSRGLGYAALVVGGTAVLFVPITALSRDPGARDAAVFVGVGAGVLLAAGAAVLLWPPYGERAIVADACH